MKRVAKDSITLEGTGLVMSEGSPAIFTTDTEVPKIVARVDVDGDELVFFPDRSASQRQLMKLLGIA